MEGVKVMKPPTTAILQVQIHSEDCYIESCGYYFMGYCPKIKKYVHSITWLISHF